MIFFNVAVWIILAIHFAAVVAVFIGTFRKRPAGPAAEPLPVTVFILPRHDPDLLADTLAGLQLQDYPSAAYRIVVLYDGPRAPEPRPPRKGDAPVSFRQADDGTAAPDATGDGLHIVIPAGYVPRRRWISLMVRSAAPGTAAAGFVVAHARRRSAGADMRNLDRLYWQTVMKGVAGWGGRVAVSAAGVCRTGGDDGAAVFTAAPGAVLLRPPQPSAGAYLDTRTRWLRRITEPGRAARLFMGMAWAVKAFLAVSLGLCIGSSWQLILTMLYIFIYTGTNLPLLLRGVSLSGTGGALGQAIPHQLASIGWDLWHLPRSMVHGHTDTEREDALL